MRGVLVLPNSQSESRSGAGSPRLAGGRIRTDMRHTEDGIHGEDTPLTEGRAHKTCHGIRGLAVLHSSTAYGSRPQTAAASLLNHRDREW